MKGVDKILQIVFLFNDTSAEKIPPEKPADKIMTVLKKTHEQIIE